MFLICLILCFLVAVEPQKQSGELSPPYNLTLDWLSDFEPHLRWSHQRLAPSCGYKVSWTTAEKNSRTERDQQKEGVSIPNLIMEGGSIFFSVQTTCNQNQSQPVYLNVTYPELVNNVQCDIISSTLTRCTWAPLRLIPDLSFFYRLVDELDDSAPEGVSLSECPRYLMTRGVRTGCRLTSRACQSVTVLFNGTVDGSPVRNTFQKKVVGVRPRPLRWNVSQVVDGFNLSWTPPDVLRLENWRFIINYTECDSTKRQIVQGATWMLMTRVPRCPYRLTLKAQSDRGETDWSHVKYFGAEEDPNALLYAAIVVSMLCAGLVLLLGFYWTRNKERFFKKVPQPRDLLSDIPNGKNKGGFYNLNFPIKEEKECQISVVKDQQLLF
ncbi:interleukin-13 receptor subunit alpha-1 [Stigmatopora nigra]